MVVDLNLKTNNLTNKQRRKGSTNTQYVLIITNNKTEHMFVNVLKRIILTYFSRPPVFIYFISTSPLVTFNNTLLLLGNNLLIDYVEA